MTSVSRSTAHAPTRTLDAEHVHDFGGAIAGGDPDTWYPAMWRWAKERYGVTRMIDVGAGYGNTARFWRQLGCDVTAVEGHPEFVAQSVIPAHTRQHDFRTGPCLFDGPVVDFAWCCEVAEHIEEDDSQHLLRTLGRARVVALTHGTPGQPGIDHCNCQPSSYWVRKMLQRGLRLDYAGTRTARGLSHAYFARTGLIFTRTGSIVPSRLGLLLLQIEWAPRRVFRAVWKRTLGRVFRTARG
jgi:hypothetical protein